MYASQTELQNQDLVYNDILWPEITISQQQMATDIVIVAGMPYDKYIHCWHKID